MKKYKIYIEKKDFIVDEEIRNLTGTRTKKMAFIIKTKEKAILKYNKSLNCTELASEKIAYEIANVLGVRFEQSFSFDSGKKISISNKII